MKKPITILYPITDLSRDGAQRQLLELVRGLDKDRFRPIVLVLRQGGSLESEFSEIPGLELLFLNQRGKYDFLCLFKAFNIMRKMKVDVVQPFLTPATFFGLLPALVYHKPVTIVTERNSAGRTTMGFGYRLYSRMETILSHLADLAVANSEAGSEYLLQRGIKPERARVIYNGLNLNHLTANPEAVERVRQSLGVPQNGKVVGVIARLFPQKRHDIFLQAAAHVIKTAPDTRFAIVGGGPLRSELERLSQALGLDSQVVFFGEQQDIGPFISASDIAALSSESEGCSNSLLEAMALGKPVVATDVGGNREVVSHGETGILVPSGNAEALAEAIITLLLNPSLVQDMGRRGSERVLSIFSLEVMVRQYESLYQETLREKADQRNPLATVII